MLGTERRGLPSRRTMTVLGKIPSVPKPLNLPSQKLENKGLDPNVEIVPRGGTWGNTVAKSPPKHAWGMSTSPSSSAGSGLSQSGSRPVTPVTPSTSSNPWTGSASAHSVSSTGTSLPSSFSTIGADASHSRPNSSGGRLSAGNDSTNQRPTTASSLVDLHPTDRILPPRPRSAESRSDHIHSSTSNAFNHERWGSPSSNNNPNQSENFHLSGGDFPTLGSKQEKERPKSADHKSSSDKSNQFGDDIPPPTTYMSTPDGGTAETWKKESTSEPNVAYDSLQPGSSVPSQPSHDAKWQRERWQQESSSYRPPIRENWQREGNPQNPPFPESWNGPGPVNVNSQTGTWHRDVSSPHTNSGRPPFDKWQKDPLHTGYPSFPQGMPSGPPFPGNFSEAPILPNHPHGFRPLNQQGVYPMNPMNGTSGSFPNRRRNGLDRNPRDMTYPNASAHGMPPDHRPDHHRMMNRPNSFGGFFGPRANFSHSGEGFRPSVMSPRPNLFAPPPFGWNQVNSNHPNFLTPSNMAVNASSVQTSTNERFEDKNSRENNQTKSISTSPANSSTEGKPEIVTAEEKIKDKKLVGEKEKEIEGKENEKKEKKVKGRSLEWGDASEEEMDFSKPVFGKEDGSDNLNQRNEVRDENKNSLVLSMSNHEAQTTIRATHSESSVPDVRGISASEKSSPKANDTSVGEIRGKNNASLTHDRNFRILKRSEDSNAVSSHGELDTPVLERDTQQNHSTNPKSDHAHSAQESNTEPDVMPLENNQSEPSKPTVNETQIDGRNRSTLQSSTEKFKASSDKGYDYEAQRARLKENAQRAKQLKMAEEEERMKEQAARARARLDELNRKSTMNKQEQNQNRSQEPNPEQAQVANSPLETNSKSTTPIETQAPKQIHSPNQNQIPVSVSEKTESGDTTLPSKDQDAHAFHPKPRGAEESGVEKEIKTNDSDEKENDVSIVSNEVKNENLGKEKQIREKEEVAHTDTQSDLKKESSVRREVRSVEKRPTHPTFNSHRGGYRRDKKDMDYRAHPHAYREYREKEKVYVEKGKTVQLEHESSQEVISHTKEERGDEVVHPSVNTQPSPLIESNQEKKNQDSQPLSSPSSQPSAVPLSPSPSTSHPQLSHFQSHHRPQHHNEFRQRTNPASKLGHKVPPTKKFISNQQPLSTASQLPMPQAATKSEPLRQNKGEILKNTDQEESKHVDSHHILGTQTQHHSSSTSSASTSKSSMTSQAASLSASSNTNSSSLSTPLPELEYMSFGEFIVPKPTVDTALSIGIAIRDPSLGQETVPHPHPVQLSDKEVSNTHQTKTSTESKSPKVNVSDTIHDSKSRSTPRVGLESSTGPRSLTSDSQSSVSAQKGIANTGPAGSTPGDRGRLPPDTTFAARDIRSTDSQKTNSTHHVKQHTGVVHDGNSQQHAEIINKLWACVRTGMKNHSQRDTKKLSNSNSSDLVPSESKEPSDSIPASKEKHRNEGVQDHGNKEVEGPSVGENKRKNAREIDSEKIQEAESNPLKNPAPSNHPILESQHTEEPSNKQPRKNSYTQSQSFHGKPYHGHYQLNHAHQNQHQGQYQQRQSYSQQRHAGHGLETEPRHVAISHSSDVKEEKRDTRFHESAPSHSQPHYTYGGGSPLLHRSTGEGSLGRGRGRGKHWEKKIQKVDSPSQPTEISNSNLNSLETSNVSRDEQAQSSTLNQRQNPSSASNEGKTQHSEEDHTSSKNEKPDHSKSTTDVAASIKENERDRGAYYHAGNSFGRGRGGHVNSGHYYNKPHYHKQNRRGAYESNPSANFNPKEAISVQNPHHSK